MPARLIGAPPDYIGYAQGSYLTERVRRKPYVTAEASKINASPFYLL